MSDLRYFTVRKLDNGFLVETHSTLDFKYGYASLEEVYEKLKQFYKN